MTSKRREDPPRREQTALAPGLWLVATPIGAADDITLRALDVLARAEVLAAEDTRQTRKLFEIHGVALAGRTLLPYHDRNGPAQRPKLLAELRAGRSVALVSDAGTPLISDPGYALVQEAIAEGIAVHPVPGASAVLAALSVAGLPTDRFLFAGFLPAKAGAARRSVEAVSTVPATLVFFEAARRVPAALALLADILGGERPAAICRELTKRFEEVRRAPLTDLAEALADGPALKGEVVIVVGPPVAQRPTAEDQDAALRAALATMSVRDAAREVARTTGAARSALYARALELEREE
ncbi:MAG: 16S rRNA (cytidine(1402)-2'-O)-methyltransferase [Pseudomonadota bacterium]